MSKLRDGLEIVAKLLIFMSGICYVTGLIVVNAHLSQYGYYSLNLLQLSYVTAGIWALVPILIVVVLVIHMCMMFRTDFPLLGAIRLDVEEYRSSRFAWKLLVVVLFTAVVVFIAAVGDISLGIIIGPNSLRALAAATLAGFVLFLLVRKLSSYKSPYTAGTVVDTFVLIFVCILVYVLYVSYFGRTLYKELPSRIGGGHPQRVCLVVESAAKPYLENAEVRFSDGTNKSDPVDLIASTDKEYVLLSKSSASAISITNGLVKAVLFEK